MISDFEYPNYTITESPDRLRVVDDKLKATICATPLNYKEIKFITIADYVVGTCDNGMYDKSLIEAHRFAALVALRKLLNEAVKSGMKTLPRKVVCDT